MTSVNDSPPSYSRQDESAAHHDQNPMADADSAFDSFILNHPRHQVSARTAPSRLHNPVVIPQRRPGTKERGFVKAYAPDLDAFGIDQESFLAFIDAVNKAARASKWLYAIQVAAMGTGFVPNHIAMGVSAAVQVIAGIVAKTEMRWKTNSFMDRMNNEFFRPRGLYCLIMSYNPVNIGEESAVDPVQAASDHQPSSSSTHTGSSFSSKAKRNLRNPSAGVSQGEENLPDSVAELIYPEAEDASQEEVDTNSKKRAFARLNNYFDRRAQARYAAESKGDVLSSAPQKRFSNRYLDPNHPASNGGLLGLLSGGKLTPDREKQNETMRLAMSAQEQAVRDQQSAQMASLGPVLQGMGLTPDQQRDYVQQYETANALQLQQFEQQSKLLERGQRRINRNILYLMIVNMATDEEMAAALRREEASLYGQSINNVAITSVNVE